MSVYNMTTQLRVCERRLTRIHIFTRANSTYLCAMRRLLRVCACARRLDERLLGSKARIGGGGRQDNGVAKGPRSNARRWRWKKAREGSEIGGSVGSMITGYHRGDHPAIRSKLQVSRTSFAASCHRSFEKFFLVIYFSHFISELNISVILDFFFINIFAIIHFFKACSVYLIKISDLFLHYNFCLYIMYAEITSLDHHCHC